MFSSNLSDTWAQPCQPPHSPNLWNCGESSGDSANSGEVSLSSTNDCWSLWRKCGNKQIYSPRYNHQQGSLSRKQFIDLKRRCKISWKLSTTIHLLLWWEVGQSVSFTFCHSIQLKWPHNPFSSWSVREENDTIPLCYSKRWAFIKINGKCGSCRSFPSRNRLSNFDMSSSTPA